MARSNMDFMPRSNVRRFDKAEEICRYGNNSQTHLDASAEARGNKNGFTIKREKITDVEELPKVPPASIALEIVDKRINLPIKLKKIAASIKEAIQILEYEDNWDDEGALATDIETFIKAIDFLTSYSVSLLKYGTIDKPYVDIMRDGSVSIMWETEKATLLAIFKKGNRELSYLYGQPKDKAKQPFPYSVENGSKIDEILALWMRQYLI